MVFTPGDNEGGGIYQDFSGAPYGTVSADIASHNPSSGSNADCGTFKLQLDGATVASHAFGACAGFATVRWHLSAQVPSGTFGVHEVRILITRVFATLPSTTPDEYVDNVRVNLRISKV